MNFKRSLFSILNRERGEIEYIKGVYKSKIQAEIESYKDPEDEDKRDTCLLYTSPSPRDS